MKMYNFLILNAILLIVSLGVFLGMIWFIVKIVKAACD